MVLTREVSDVVDVGGCELVCWGALLEGINNRLALHALQECDPPALSPHPDQPLLHLHNSQSNGYKTTLSVLKFSPVQSIWTFTQ